MQMKRKTSLTHIIFIAATLSVLPLTTGCDSKKASSSETVHISFVTGDYEQISAEDQHAFTSFYTEVRAKAQNITVDGSGDEWEGIPSVTSPVDQTLDPARDITRFSIAPLEDGIFLALWTNGVPSTKRWSYFFDLDLTDIEGAERDFQFGIYSLESENNVKITGPHNDEIRGEVSEIKFSSNTMLEVYIPWSYLEEIASQKSPAFKDARNNRRYCRVKALSYDNETSQRIDTAPVLASYKLLSTFNPMTEPPRTVDRTAVISFPFNGLWFLRPGPYQIETHDWEYDFHIRDQYNERTTSSLLEDYYAWNQPVYAPADGTASRVVNNTADNEPGVIPDDYGVNNGTWIETDIALLHMKQYSVFVTQGQIIKKGDLLGYVGNSGRTGVPHIHVGAYDKDDGNVSIPLLLKDVTVGINTWEGDPWALNYTLWLARNAYAVKSQSSK